MSEFKPRPESFVGKPLTPMGKEETAKRKAEAGELTREEQGDIQYQLRKAARLNIIPPETPQEFPSGRREEKKER